MGYRNNRGKLMISSYLLLYAALEVVKYCGQQSTGVFNAQDLLDQKNVASSNFYVGFTVQAKDHASPRRKLAGEKIVEITAETYTDGKSSVQDGYKCPDDVNGCFKLASVETVSGNGASYRGY